LIYLPWRDGRLSYHWCFACLCVYRYSEEEISHKVSVYRQMLMDNLQNSVEASSAASVVEKDDLGRPVYVILCTCTYIVMSSVVISVVMVIETGTETAFF